MAHKNYSSGRRKSGQNWLKKYTKYNEIVYGTVFFLCATSFLLIFTYMVILKYFNTTAVLLCASIAGLQKRVVVVVVVVVVLPPPILAPLEAEHINNAPSIN